MSNKVRLVNDSRALISMRESDFDAYSAYGEVVDNAVQAEASFCRIQMRTQQRQSPGRPFQKLASIAFGDDGTGMDTDTLHKCLQLGYSSRYDDRSGIGRFGVGMTLAAINQCKHVEVYSKVQGGQWHSTSIDLDQMTSGAEDDAGIPEPTPAKIPDEYTTLVGSASGTLVIWSKYDRQPYSASTMKEKLRIWLGRTYREFIWDGLTISLDGAIIPAIDPLYHRIEKTAYPEDPQATLYEPIEIKWPIPDDAQQPGGPRQSSIKIRMSLLPEAFRKHQGAGNAQENRERSIHLNEGISILRNGREVFYGPVPYWPHRGKNKWFSEIDRWWSCEIRFDAVLDRVFTVKNIKRGAVPNAELKESIADLIAPTRDTCLESVRKLWAKTKNESLQGSDSEEKPSRPAERIAKKTPTDKSLIDKDKDFEKEAKRLIDKRSDLTDEEKAQIVAKWKSQPFTIETGSWRGPQFFEAAHLGGSDVIRYNFDHDFFKEVNALLDGLGETQQNQSPAARLKCLMDLLLISYCKAEAKFEPDMVVEVSSFVEDMKMNWGQYLASYLRTYLRELGDVQE
ncbi:MAG: ATP-binding protein [Planctomycetes bacterium]|nr:ATP-binding protein [Planctomycetota bacterium]